MADISSVSPEGGYFPASLLQCSPPRRQGGGAIGSYSTIHLDPSRCLARFDLDWAATQWTAAD